MPTAQANEPAGHGRAAAFRWSLLASLPALLLLAWQSTFVWPFFSDDAFISLRYSQRLLAGDGLSWTDGERVEGYSNLLWVLLTAGLGGLGLDLVTGARVLGAAATTVALFALAHALRPHTLATAAKAALAPLLVASTQVVLGWTLAGLEGPLVLCCLSLGFAALLHRFATSPDVASWPRRWLGAASVPFALLCLTRPDGPLWVATTALGLGLASAAGGRTGRGVRAATFAALPALATLGQLAFRLAWHGDVVPNTAHVKAELDPQAWPAGLAYVGHAVVVHAGLVVPATLAWGWLLLRASTRPLALLLGLPVLAWLSYLVAIGGDHFPCRRLLHGAVAPLALLTVALLQGPGWWRWLLALLLLGGAGWNVQLARDDAQSHELRAETWEWTGRAVGTALHAAFGSERPLLAVDAAGALPYYSQLPALDLLGLCDRTIATTPLPSWFATMVPGTPKPPGHLRGNGRYVMDRGPDLCLFGPPPGRPLPVFVSGAEFEDDPRFQHGYRLVQVDLGVCEVLPGRRETITVPLWVKLDGRAGVQRDAERIHVPGWLFGSFTLRVPIVGRYQPPPTDPEMAAARAQHLGELVAWLGQTPAAAVPDARGLWRGRLGQPRSGLRLSLPAGTWRARAEPANAGVQIVCTTATAHGTDDGFQLAATGEHELVMQVPDGVALPVWIDRVVLERQPR